ncbi:MAG: hypothetical protein WC980_02855 [Candidatus Brocadiia bacterium]
MVMLCPRCAYPNQPYILKCQRCNSQLRSEEEAKHNNEEWVILPEKIRIEFEDNYKLAQEHSRRIMAFSFRKKFKYVLMGGIMLGVVGFLNWFVRFLTMSDILDSVGGILFFISPEIIAGGIAGFLLIKSRGGPHKGMILFISAFIASAVVKYLLNWVDMPFTDPFGTIEFLYLSLVVLCLGYLMGQHIYIKYFA